MALSDLDAFRLELGDTDPDAPLFTDPEALHFLNSNPGRVLLAVADACDALARRYARQADLTIKSADDTVTRKLSTIAAGYAERAADLRRRATGTGAPWAGGLSKHRKTGLAADTDREQPRFARGQFDAPTSTN